MLEPKVQMCFESPGTVPVAPDAQISLVGMPCLVEIPSSEIESFGYGYNFHIGYPELNEIFKEMLSTVFMGTVDGIIIPQLIPQHTLERYSQDSSKEQLKGKLYRDSLLPGKWTPSLLNLLPSSIFDVRLPIVSSKGRDYIPMAVLGYVVGVKPEFVSSVLSSHPQWQEESRKYLQALSEKLEESTGLIVRQQCQMSNVMSSASIVSIDELSEHLQRYSWRQSLLMSDGVCSETTEIKIHLNEEQTQISLHLSESETLRGHTRDPALSRKIIEDVVYFTELYEDRLDIYPETDNVVQIITTMGPKKRKMRRRIFK